MNTEQITMKFGKVFTITNRWSDYMLGKIAAGAREQWIDVKPVLPRSK